MNTGVPACSTARTAVRVLTWLAACVFAMVAVPASAGELFMARSTQAFPEAMLSLQDSLQQHGYVISRVQRVDIGLTKFGYKTDKYRVVFFGKPKEVERLTERYPDLIPYLPLKIALFAERQDTVFVASNPHTLAGFFKHPELKATFDRWERDMQSVFDAMRGAR